MEINYVCSLGSLCHTACLMQRNNLKCVSYPFDWIFSNYNNIIHCIENNFQLFLDKSFYYSISENECGHSFYDKYLSNPMWRHHNPLLNINHYEYIQRCVIRFQNLLQLDKPKLFIMSFVNLLEVNEKTIIDLLEFNNNFSKYVKNKNYILLVIFHLPDKYENYHNFKNIGNIHFLTLHTKSKSNGIIFYDENDNLYLDCIITSRYTAQFH